MRRSSLLGGYSMGFSGEILKVLVVEDNATFRGILKEFLQTFFPSIVIYEAAEGNEAFQILDTYHPELVFMDIRLPGENGLKLTKRIKTNDPDTKVIILTNYDMLEYQQEALRSGANCFISKDSMSWQQIETCIKSFSQVQ